MSTNIKQQLTSVLQGFKILLLSMVSNVYSLSGTIQSANASPKSKRKEQRTTRTTTPFTQKTMPASSHKSNTVLKDIKCFCFVFSFFFLFFCFFFFWSGSLQQKQNVWEKGKQANEKKQTNERVANILTPQRVREDFS